MVYGQNPKYRNNGCLGAKPRIEVCQTTMTLVRNHNISRAQIIGVGENPLNRKGLLSTHNGGDEEIV
jgi:hypothetical protein